MRSDLASHVHSYESGLLARPKADPLGQRGLPGDRAGLDRLVDELAERLRSAGEAGVRGEQLAEEMGLPYGTRSLRLLVAYAWVHRNLGEIVGVPGDGYYWGESRPELYGRQSGANETRARDLLFTARLWRRMAARHSCQGSLLPAVDAGPDRRGERI